MKYLNAELLYPMFICSPDFRFNDHFDDNSQQDDQPKKLLRRDPECRSFDEVAFFVLLIFVSDYL